MTKSIVLFFLLIAGMSRSQTEKAILHQHFWAGGVCCSNGTDYTLTVTFPAKGFVCFDSLEIVADGIRMTIPDNSITLTKRGDSLLIYTYKFGYSSNKAYDYYEEGHTFYYGMEEKHLLKRLEPEPMTIKLIRSGKEPESITPEFTQSITAYP